MSNAEDFYGSRPASTAQSVNPLAGGLYDNTDTPPPPPPKPGSHETSRRGTPLPSGPPLPPTPIRGQPTPPPGAPARTATHSGAYLQQTQPQPSFEPQIPPPSLQDNWIPPILQDKSRSDLGPLLSNPQLLNSLSVLHPSHASSLAPVSAQLNANSQSANRVLETAHHLSQLRDQTQTLLLQHTTLSTQWRRKQAEMDKALEPWSPKAMHQRLVASIAEQEAVVRAIEESFLDSGDHAGAIDGDEDFYGGGGGSSARANAGKATEREVNDWLKRIREGVQTLEMRKEMRGRWDEGRVGGWR